MDLDRTVTVTVGKLIQLAAQLNQHMDNKEYLRGQRDLIVDAANLSLEDVAVVDKALADEHVVQWAPFISPRPKPGGR